MGVVALATYSHGCEGRSRSLKTLIRYWDYLQNLSTLYLQSAFLLRTGGQQFYMGVVALATYSHGCEGRSPS